MAPRLSAAGLPTAEQINSVARHLVGDAARSVLFVSSDRSTEVKTTMSTAAIVASLACVAVALSACNPEQTSSQSTGQPGAATKSYTFGLANQQESVTFPAALAKGAKAKAAELGVKIVDLDSQGDQNKQASGVQDLIAQNVDAIVLVPLSPGPAQALAD